MMARLEELCTKASSNIAQKDLDNHNGCYPIYGASGFIKNVDFYTQEKPYVAIVKDGAGVGRVMILPAKSSVIGTMQYILPNDNVNVEYLAYALESMNLSKYYTGATIPHIYFKDYCKEVLPNHSLLEQINIAEQLNKVDTIISLRKQQLAKLDELVKSRFIEMFGDPVINPQGWKIAPLSRLIVTANNGMARRGKDEDGSIVLRLVELQNGFIDYSKPNRIKLTEAEKKRYRLIENDFLFARVNGNPDYVGRCAVFNEIGEPVYHNDHIIRVHFDDSRINGCFTSVLLNSEYGKRQLKEQIKTSAGQYTISQDGIGAIITIIPPLSLQTEFATFVEQTDKSKFEIQKSLNQLETLKKALMQKYFG